MNRFKTALELQGFPLKKAEQVLNERKKNIQIDGCDILNEKKWDIFNFQKSHNEFYDKFLADRKVEKWEDIPIMTKQDLQIPLEQRLSKGYTKKSVFVNKTSGSSGHPFIFAKDKFAHALSWAHIIDLYQQFNVKIGKSLEARFYGIPKDFKGHQKERLKDKMAKRYRFDIFDLSEKNLSTFVRIFKQKPFEYINGYTSSIVMFAKYLKDRKIILKHLCPTLKVCFTTSEMLFENDRQLLRESFGVQVIKEYGASEFGVIAFENENQNWLLNNLTLYTEVVDENGKPWDFGQEGDLVVTSLDNKAHPFIRYKIGDVGILSQPKRDNRQTLEKLTGRTNVFAVLPSGKKVPALSFYYVTKSVIDNNGNVKELKVVQEKINQFLIRYVADQELNPFQKTSIKNAIEKYLEPGLELRFIRAQALKRTKRGKLLQFESLL